LQPIISKKLLTCLLDSFRVDGIYQDGFKLSLMVVVNRNHQ